MYAGKGNDYYDLTRSQRATIELHLGDGLDTLVSGRSAVLSFGEGVTRASLQLVQARSPSSSRLSFALAYGDGGDRIFMDEQTSSNITVGLADGSSVSWDELTAQGVRIDMADNPGPSGYDGYGTDYRDTIVGRRDDNKIQGYGGDDVIDGGAGNDEIDGGTGSDVFLFGRGDGQDTIRSSWRNAGDQDVLRFKVGVSPADVMFFRRGDDLIARLVGSADMVTVVEAYSNNPLHRVEFFGGPSKLTLNSWYAGSGYQVEEFRTSEGHVLIDTQVQNLVQAMASFAPPPAGQTTLPQAYQNSLAPLLAADWR